MEGHKTPSVQSCFSLRMNLSEQDLSGRPLLPTKKIHTESLEMATKQSLLSEIKTFSCGGFKLDFTDKDT